MFAKVKPNTQIIGQNIIYFNRVESTNQFALELIRQNLADNGTVLVAEFQTKGRGQLNKSWISEPFENLMFSIILKHVTFQPTDPFIINKTLTLAMYNFLKRKLPEQQVYIKWPNDILVNNKKICGILVENNFSGSTLNYSVLGIGLNVNQHFEHIQHLNATSLTQYFGGELDREALLTEILETIESTFDQLSEDGPTFIENSFNAALYGYKVNAIFEIDDALVMASVSGCDKEGRLILDIEGIEKHFLHGTIKQFIAQ